MLDRSASHRRSRSSSRARRASGGKPTSPSQDVTRDREVTPSSRRRPCAQSDRPTWPPPSTPPAESLPFADETFDAAMTTFSVHQWGDLAAGLRELRRVRATT